jgi:hypothetical protein
MTSLESSRLSEISRRLLDYTPVALRENSDIYLVGSARNSKKKFFNSKLSDIDLLIVSGSTNLEELTDRLEQVFHLAMEIDQSSHELFEIFFATSSAVSFHFSCLSVIGGAQGLNAEDLLVGSGKYGTARGVEYPSVTTRKKLYIARADGFCSEYGHLLPLADTSSARKTAKILHRGMKLLICSYASPDRLDEVENELFSISSFGELKVLFKTVRKHGLEVDDIIERAFQGQDISDWPRWMVAQDEIARQLLELIQDQRLPIEESRLHETLASAVHDMLIAGLKEIFGEKNPTVRRQMIEKYADNTASMIVKLALSGVKSLYDLDSKQVMDTIRESYHVLTDHLGGESGSDTRLLAAAISLLEYSVTEGVKYANLLNES